MKKSIALLSFAGLVSTAPLANADTIFGIYAGGGQWNTDISGEIGDTGLPSADLEDLGLKDQDNTFVYAAVEHPIPVIPNIRVQMNDIEMSETSTIQQSFVLDGRPYLVSDQVTSDFDLSHTDATLYYEVLDNWVTADFGLTIRQFDGYLRVRSNITTLEAEQELDETLPLVYLKGQVELPLTGFYVNASANAISYDGNDVTDLQAGVGYMSDGLALDIGVEVGLRNFSVTLDDVSGVDGDMDMNGAYASLNLHF